MEARKPKRTLNARPTTPGRARSFGSYEAKTHLPRLLAEVEAGARIMITRNGQPIAVLSGIEARDECPVSEVIEQLRVARKGVHLGGLDVAELKRIGRK